MEPSAEAQRKKEEIRREARQRRRLQENAEQHSRHILGQLAELPQYGDARTVMSYVSFRGEVCTRQFLPRVWKDGKRLVVPYCLGSRLELFRLDNMEELGPGTLGILEPTAALRGGPGRRIAPEELDLIVVPGLAFDRQCGRIGYGKGYYDRLLRQVRPETAVLAVAFECQVFPEVPMLPYDVRVDGVITESAVYRRGGPRAGA